MRQIYFVGKMRGFIKHLLEAENKFYRYEIDTKSKSYEINSRKKIFMKKIFGSKIFDFLGIILVKKINIENENNIAIVYNRFLETNKPYVIILENPTALYHYRLKRSKSKLGRNKLKKCLGNKNLKAIVCISKACEITIRELLNNDINNEIKIVNIYPYIPNRLNFNIDVVKNRKKIRCLFISSDFELKSGKEIVEAFDKLDQRYFELKVITKTNSINSDYRKKIEKMENVEIIEFGVDFQVLSKYYEEADILLHLTRQDSFALVILEAMKAGLCILATDLYAIPEMVSNGINGYLTKPKYYFFDNKTKLPNESVWNNRKETIYSDYIDKNIIEFIIEKLNKLESNRENLYKMRKKSYEIANAEVFNEKEIIKKWNRLYDEILEEA